MAFLFSDGFDSYAATADLTKKWGSEASPWTWNSSGGRTGGGYISVTNSPGNALNAPASIFTGVTVCLGFDLKISAAPGSQNSIIEALGSGGSRQVALQVAANGTLVARNIGGAANLASGSTNVCDNQWHWVEWQFTSNGGTGGPHKCYVDGVLQWSISANTSGSASPPTTFDLTALSGAGVTLSFDDIIVYDDSTGAPQLAAFPLGPREITSLRPNGDAAVQFTPNTGSTNFTQIDETNGDGDTSYVQDGNTGDQDLYNYADIAFNPANISGVMLNSYLENPSAGTITAQGICKSNTTQTNGTAQQVPSGYKVQQQPFPVDPNTSAAWTVAGFNAATFGLRVNG